MVSQSDADRAITPQDLYYLQDKDLARSLYALGIKASSALGLPDEGDRGAETLSKAASVSASSNYSIDPESSRKNKWFRSIPDLSERIEGNLSGKIQTILFLRILLPSKRVISSYIDLHDRLHSTSPWNLVKPLSTRDLSYFDWDTHETTQHDTVNWQVLVNANRKLQFRNRTDRKVIIPAESKGTQASTDCLQSLGKSIQQIVFYDHHVTRSIWR